MTRNRWLAALLLLSWTLNVALIVALISRKVYQPGGYPQPMTAPHPMPGWGQDDVFLKSALPLQERRHELMREMGEAFSADQLDTALIRRISDSLEMVRSELQRNFLGQMMRRHGMLSPEERQQYCQRMMAPMGGPSGGRRGHKRR